MVNETRAGAPLDIFAGPDEDLEYAEIATEDRWMLDPDALAERADLPGLRGPARGVGAPPRRQKYNHAHDERGRRDNRG